MPPEPALAASAAPAVAPTSTSRTFSSAQVAVAAFFGGPLGGTILIGLNEARLGRKRNALLAVLGGLALSVFLLWSALVLPYVPYQLLPFLSAAGLQVFAQQRYGKLPLVPRSNWTVCGVTLGGLVMTAGLVLAALFLHHASANIVSIGETDVTYLSGTTVEDAGAVATFIENKQRGSGATVVIQKLGSRLIVGIVMKDDAFDDRNVRLAVQAIGTQLSTLVFHGAPVEMQMLDAGLVGRVVIPFAKP